MNIIEVCYRELRSGPGHNHTAIEVRAEVADDETPEQALERAKWWVRNKHYEIAEYDRRTIVLEHTKNTIERQIHVLTRQHTRLVEELRLTTRWRVFRDDLRHWWQKRVLRREHSDRELDEVPF